VAQGAFAALGLDPRLSDSYAPLVEVDVLDAQPEKFAVAEPAVAGEVDERSPARRQRGYEPLDVLW